MTTIKRHLVNHLMTFSLQKGDDQGVEEALSRLSYLAKEEKLWSQQMYLDIDDEAVYLRDTKTKEELESYTFQNIYRCDAITTEKHFPSLLSLVCQSVDQKKPDILFFNCETAQGQQIRADITNAISASSKQGKKVPDGLRFSQDEPDVVAPYDIPSPPIPHAPNAPPANPPPYPGLRVNRPNGGPDISFLRAEREVGILNHCFDDIEKFMGKLQQAAEAATVINQKKKKKKKSKKQTAEDDLLAAKARPPPEEEFIDIFQKFKYCFCLLARLKSTITDPTAEELVHHVFKPLDMLVKTTGGPALGASVSSPALTASAVTLLQDNLNKEEKELWTSLGPNWMQSLSKLRGPVAPYTPVFSDGWKPEAARADGQVWEDPVESQHKHEALQEKQELNQAPPDVHIGDETEEFQPNSERLYSCSYAFIARNSSELSVQQGETLEVIDSSKRWWKCRNRFNQVGYVPFNLLEPAAHIESPVTHKPPSAPAPPPLNKTVGVAPSPPSLSRAPSHSPNPRPRSMLVAGQLNPAADEPDKAMMVNDELLQRLANGKASLQRTLVIPRSSETTIPLDYHSPPEEVAAWLKGKGFSDPTVKCLGVLTGAQLFSLNKEELRTVIPEEGARVYSQLTVQKTLLEDARRATELEAVMEKQKMKVDLKLESSTL